jgi:hypothetical protein
MTLEEIIDEAHEDMETAMATWATCDEDFAEAAAFICQTSVSTYGRQISWRWSNWGGVEFFAAEQEVA